MRIFVSVMTTKHAQSDTTLASSIQIERVICWIEFKSEMLNNERKIS